MNKIFLLLILLITYPLLNIAQETPDLSFEIKGRLAEISSEEPIPFAHVFIEGTLMGTTTDEDGYFILRVKEITSKPIIFSAIGYESEKITGYRPDQELKIFLKPDVYMLDDVVIRADNLPNRRKMRMFESYFLGISDNAINSEIINPEVLDLFYDKKTKTLYADASEPIIIENPALGYRIIYHLEDFMGSHKSIKYTGDYYFETLEDNQKYTEKAVEDNRKQTFLGSRLHLIRSIWDNDLKKQGFSLFYNNYKKVKIEEVIADLPTKEKILCFRQGIIIYYGNSYNTTTSYLSQNEGCTKIANDGYFDPQSIQWSGEISEKRVADLLPYEYQPEQ